MLEFLTDSTPPFRQTHANTMAVGLFDLDDCENGIALPGHFFASMPIAPSTRWASRRPSPAPLAPVAEQGRLDGGYHHGLELDTPDSCDSAHSDLFDEPAWFGHDAFGTDSDAVLCLPSAPLSCASLCTGELSFLSDANVGSATADLWCDAPASGGCNSPVCFLVASLRPTMLAGKRAREDASSLIPSGAAICAALWAAAPAIGNDEVRPLKRACAVAAGEPASFASTVSWCSSHGFVPFMHAIPSHGAPQMHRLGAPHLHGFGAPYVCGVPGGLLPLSRSCSAAETIAVQPCPLTLSEGFSRTSSAAFSRTSSSASTTRRGENVKGNPQMQKMARDGQRHWQDKCKQLPAEAEEAGTSTADAQFQIQRHTCAARNLKCQKESLLIFLQMAAQQRLISPLAFVHAGDEAAGFVGWTGFHVEPGCGQQFRAGVERLFPETPKLNTLYHLFRRSGLVPQDWRRAWEGQTPFLWNPNRVS